MSIFERRELRKVYLDDTQPLLCSIISSEISQGHTEYVIRVQRGPLPENSWYVYKRYNDFVALHQLLQGCGLLLPLPPKRLIGNFDREFIAERQTALQKYLDVVLQNQILSSHLTVKRFLDPDNYGTLYQELGLAHIRMALRGELNIEVAKPLPDIGWRLRKQHFLVYMKSETKRELLLSWVPFGPDKYLEEKHIQSALKSLCTLQHVNIAPLEIGGVFEGGGWVIKNVYKNGTLLDYISGIKNPYTTSALKKYCNYKTRKQLPVCQVIDIASQILQGLAYLHHKGIPYGHLHLGNILLLDGTVKLLEIENALFGLPCYYRPYLTEHKQLASLQFVDVFCLGLVMYEMLFSERFNDYQCHSMPPNCPAILKPMLESVLTLNGIKNGIPTVTSLLNMEIFKRSPPKPHPYIKLSTTVKQHLLAVTNQTVQRLKDDHSKVRQQRRAVKMQEILNAEEHKTILPKRQKSSKQKIRGDVNANGKWAERSGSPTSTSTTATSAGTTTPPAPIVPGQTSSRLIPVSTTQGFPIETETLGRMALLGDICNFKKEGLRRVQPPA